MNCCGECNVEMETVLTAVLIVETGEKRKMTLRKKEDHRNQYARDKSDKVVDVDTTIKNAQASNNKQNLPHRENVGCSIKATNSIVDRVTEGVSIIQELGVSQLSRIRDQYRQSIQCSQVKRNLQSKKTSLGSLGSRRSSSLFYRQREIEVLNKELQQLKEDGLRLRKDKLEKDYQYRRQLNKISNLRDSLMTKSKERFADLTELREMFAQHRRAK